MFRIIGVVVVYGFAVFGATIIVGKYGRVIGSEKSRDKSARRGVEDKAVGADGATA